MSVGTMGIGDIRLRMHDDLKRNLISLGELDKNGYSYKGDGGVLKVSRVSLVCMKAVLKNGIYVLQAATSCGDAALGEAKSYEQSSLWHYRMAHISDQGLKELSNQGILGAGKFTALDKCDTCILVKSITVNP